MLTLMLKRVGGVCHMLKGVSQLLTIVDKGGRGGWDPPKYGWQSLTKERVVRGGGAGGWSHISILLVFRQMTMFLWYLLKYRQRDLQQTYKVQCLACKEGGPATLRDEEEQGEGRPGQGDVEIPCAALYHGESRCSAYKPGLDHQNDLDLQLTLPKFLASYFPYFCGIQPST